MILFRKRSRLIIMMFASIATGIISYSQPDIPIDAALKSNSESWKVKTKQKFINNKPSLVSFGPIKTIATDADKAQQVSREVNRALFSKNIKTVKSRESNMVMTYNDTDTLVINILTITEEEVHKRNATGTVLGMGNPEETSYRSSPLVDEMLITAVNDTAKWSYSKTDSLTFIQTGCIGKLQFGGDSFMIKPVDNYSGKKMKEVMFSQLASGFIFLHEGKQIAAFQVMMKNFVWLSKELKNNESRAVLATIAGLFSTMKP